VKQSGFEMKMKTTSTLSFLFFTHLITQQNFSHAFSLVKIGHLSRDVQEKRKFTEIQIALTPQAITTEIDIPPSDAINNVLFPEVEYKERMKIGRDAQFKINNESSDALNLAMDANDPRLSFTYHEFPLQSMDELLDLAILKFVALKGRKPRTIVDLGSGCGRCVLHAAMVGSGCDENHQTWDEVHGIEISPLMHSYAVQTIVHRGIEKGLLRKNIPISDDFTEPQFNTKIFFHCGAASEFKNIISEADIIFCYSTVFDDEGFNPDIGAMILSKEWSLMLADMCKEGTVVVTTDRALNPMYGWKLEHSLEVDNPSLLQSTGYISVKL
jgi:hypothetical protein